jgi:hypothetical protein
MFAHCVEWTTAEPRWQEVLMPLQPTNPVTGTPILPDLNLHELNVAVQQLQRVVDQLLLNDDLRRKTLAAISGVIEPASGHVHIKGILEVDQKVTFHDDVEMDNATKNVLVHGDVKLV